MGWRYVARNHGREVACCSHYAAQHIQVYTKSFKKRRPLSSQLSCIAIIFLSCALLPGFKPVSALADYHQLSPSRFVYPDERSLKGSTAAFAALHSACLMKGRSGSRWSHPLFPAACSCGVCLSWWACIPQHGITAPLLLVGLGIVHTLKCLHPTFSIASASLVALLAPFVATLLLYAGGASCHPLHMVNSVPPHLAL